MTLRRTNGFTIVELLVVIVVIAILASITVVAYNGVQQRANNSARLSEYNHWRKLYEMYKIQNGTYPTMSPGGYCLGTGFPGGKCRDYLLSNDNALAEANSVTLMDKLKTVSPLPRSNHVPVNGTVGPYVYYGVGWLQITVVLNGGPSDCPADLSYTWDDGNGRLLCYVDMQI